MGRADDELPVPSELRHLVLAAQREGNRVFARMLAGLGLTPSQAEVLTVLDEHGPLNLRDLGQMIVCEVGSPSRIVDALVRRGLVARDVHPEDRRAVTLALTEQGRALVPELREIDAQMDEATTARLTLDQRRVLRAALRGFLAGTESEAALARRFDRVLV